MPTYLITACDSQVTFIEEGNLHRSELQIVDGESRKISREQEHNFMQDNVIETPKPDILYKVH